MALYGRANEEVREMQSVYKPMYVGDRFDVPLKDGDDSHVGELTVLWTPWGIEVEVGRIDEAVTGEVKLIVH